MDRLVPDLLVHRTAKLYTASPHRICSKQCSLADTALDTLSLTSSITTLQPEPKHLSNNQSACQTSVMWFKGAIETLQFAKICQVLRNCPGSNCGTTSSQRLLQVQFWAPTAAGGGVSLVMAFLNGTDVPDLLRLQTLITKFVGSIFSCAANLTVGTEGPLVHMGACIASVIAFWECGKRGCF